MKITLAVSVVVGLLFVYGCGSDETPAVDCAASTLAVRLDSKKDVSSCSLLDGAINVSGSGGSGNFEFRLNDLAFQASGVFSNLSAGNYTVTVRDGDGCERTLAVTVQGFATNLAVAATAVVPDNQCVADNGSITVAATGGQAPFQFQLGTGAFGNSSSFSALRSGNYTISVRDAANCLQTLTVTVPRGNTGTSFANEVKTIIDNNCINCHRVGGSGPGDFTTQAGVAARAAQVKARTANGSMPPGGGLSAAQIALIGCWVDDGAANN